MSDLLSGDVSLSRFRGLAACGGFNPMIGELTALWRSAATLGVPPEGLGVILGIDRLLDMARTVPNVVGDLGAAAFVARYAEPADEADRGSGAP